MAKKSSKPAPVESPDSEAEVAVKYAKRKTAAEIRHIKKEKQRVAREGSEETRAAAHQYLRQWSTDRGSWKFNKARQLWIVRHLYLETQVPSDIFELAIQYLDGSGDMLRKSLVSDARLVAEPMSAITPELQAMRSKSLGLMPSHVTKAEANAAKRKKAAKDKPVTPVIAAKEGEKPGEKSGAEPVAAENEPADGAASESTMKRAMRVIEVLAAPKPVEPVASKETKKKRKQSTPDTSDESSGDSSSDGDEKAKKKRKTEKKSKDKKEKKEKKSRDKADKKEKKSKDKKEKKAKSKP
ncbi:hypothetical protein IWW37_001480 [Coemansia sp. RSA 2050]|nr:hypothetical protein IWW37_001480 [Coemansia sp. RSA 2050]KAJ2734390.1 hypothetical protein IW152_002399 [Coemansia sp. BCRC 34962]